MKTVLMNRFPNTPIVGIYVARRVPKTINIEDISFDFFD